MKVIRVSAIWCSSCLIMKAMVGDILKEGLYDVEIEELDYDSEEAESILAGYGIKSDILPIYIREDHKFIIGEKSKKEFIAFIED